jgi:molybdopterin-synthase adenylyltransferase
MDELSRYSRHELLRVIGREGQERIKQARVLVTGLGALGSLISMLLARAGVGFLRIVDQDGPELHNLQRQLLYTEPDVSGALTKTQAAYEHLKAANSGIVIEPITASIDETNIAGLVFGVDLVVDGLDSGLTRYCVNDAALNANVPYIFGGAVDTLGNVMTIIPGKTACLRCLWPDPDKIKNHAKASAVGVLSSGAATVAAIQVTEAFKIITGRSDDILPGLLVMDLWRGNFHVAPVEPDPNCKCRRL